MHYTNRENNIAVNILIAAIRKIKIPQILPAIRQYNSCGIEVIPVLVKNLAQCSQ